MAEENDQLDEELETGTEEAQDESNEDTSDEDERSNKSSDESEGEEQAAAGESDEDREARRERNRQMREDRKKRRHEKEESYKRELSARDRVIQEQNERLMALERRSQGADMAALDNAIKQSADAYTHFKKQHALAIEQANGAVAADAAENMSIARQRFEQLNNVKQKAQRQAQAPQPLDPRLANHAKAWMDKNKWYDPSGKDEDSSIALTIDSRMAQEGWDPTTPEYWDELDSRVKRYMPHRVNLGYNKSQGQNKRPPVAGSGRETSSSGNKSTYKLSSERVKALKDMGVWDDPVAREEHIKNFRDYDKANGLI